MVSHLFYYQLALLALVWLFVMLQQFPLIALQRLSLMSMGPFDHPFWLHARQMVIKIGTTPV